MRLGRWAQGWRRHPPPGTRGEGAPGRHTSSAPRIFARHKRRSPRASVRFLRLLVFHVKQCVPRPRRRWVRWRASGGSCELLAPSPGGPQPQLPHLLLEFSGLWGEREGVKVSQTAGRCPGSSTRPPGLLTAGPPGRGPADCARVPTGQRPLQVGPGCSARESPPWPHRDLRLQPRRRQVMEGRRLLTHTAGVGSSLPTIPPETHTWPGRAGPPLHPHPQT